MNVIALVYLFLQVVLSTSLPDRAAVRHEIALYKLSLDEDVVDPYFNEVIARRRERRQTTLVSFPSDDEDTGAADGSGVESDASVNSPAPTTRSPNPSRNDWGWFRTTVNFLDSIRFTDDLTDYRSQEFTSLASDIMSPIEDHLNANLDGYHEIIPLMFRTRGGNVYVVFDMGMCLTNSVDDIRNAISSLVADGSIGRFRVDSTPPTVFQLGVEKSRSECLAGPILPPSSSTSLTPTRPTLTTTAQSFQPIVRTTFDAPTSSSPRAPSCRMDQATCRNLQCIDRSYVCDGTRDCLDGSDEPETCQNRVNECDPTEFLCVGTGVCVQKIWRCDGDDDCGNGYDELNCPSLSFDSDCASNQFQCSNQVCIPSSHHCDGEVDCDDGSDERGCYAPVVIAPPRRSVFAFEGSTVTLHCEAAGIPTPVISWRINWGNVPPPPRVTMTSENGVGTLVIRKVKKSDQGAYTCEAMNAVDAVLATPDAVLIINETLKPPPITSNEMCQPGQYNIAPAYMEVLCRPCFCFGMTDQCHSSKYEFSEIGIEFSKPSDDQQGILLDHNDTIEGAPDTQQPITKSQIKINPPARELQLIDLSKRFLAAAHYWSLPAQFLGAKINSFGGTLTFSYSYNNSFHTTSEPIDSADVIIEGNGKTLLYNNPDPHPAPQIKHTTQVKLSEEDNWKTSDGRNATREDLMNVLENLDRVLLRTVYDRSMISTGVGDVRLQVARPRLLTSEELDGSISPDKAMAFSVEECVCPEGYTGLSCELCAPGYERYNTGPFLGGCATSDEQRGPPGGVICNVGYTGDDCSQCAQGYISYEGGCTRYPDTYCSVAGSIGRNIDQTCQCKEGCEGPRCGQCKPGYYFLSQMNPTGCLPCFCMNVTDHCVSSTWNMTILTPSFEFDQRFLLKNVDSGLVFEDGITVESSQEDGASQLYVSAPLDRFPVGIYYWMMPNELTGNKLSSYGGSFNYTISYTERADAVSVTEVPDIMITGNGLTLQFSNSVHSEPEEDTMFHVKIKEGNWLKESGATATREDVLLVLSNLDDIFVRASYSNKMKSSSIKDITLENAVPENTGGRGASQVEQCVCPPGYTGLSCENCADGYYRVEGGSYLGRCEPCNCNQHSNLCDKETGVCLNCLHNTEGHQCDRCIPGYYGDPRTGTENDCKICPCPLVDGQGSIALCSVDCEGRPVCSQCPEGYKGKTCQLCADGYERSSVDPSLCELSDCVCDPVGSADSSCDADGQCNCKPSTTGESCDQCKPGYFYLSAENQDGGCLSCFCMGVSNRCTSASLKRNQIVANFTDDYGGFRLTQQSCRTHVTEGYDVLDEGRTLSYPRLDELNADKPYFWQLPEEYRGDKIVSYGGRLDYKASYTSNGNNDINDDPDVILVGNGVMLTSRMSGSDSQIRPNDVMNRYVIFRENYWQNINGQPATREQLLMALADVDSILIRATYSTPTVRTSISDVAMETASDSLLMTEPAYEVEQCACPDGYRGLSCESCAPGFTRSESGLYIGFCHQCRCNGHSEQCDARTGRCLNCEGNTVGDSCDQCAPGYYRTASQAVTSNCETCACPGTGANNFADSCSFDEFSNSLQCTGCQKGYTGRTCESCAAGYTGDPTTPGGTCVSGNLPQVCVTPNKAKVRIGGSTTLRCTVRSNTTSTITWRRLEPNPGPLPSTARVRDGGRTVRFNFFSSSQVGTYQCIGTNRFGSDSDSATLIVAPGSPGSISTIRVDIEEPSNVTVKEGAQVSFVCTATGQGSAYIVSWTKQRGRLPLSRANDYDGVLQIRDVQLSDAGVYICTGSNMFDTDQKLARLRVIPAIRPEIPSVVVRPERLEVSEGEDAMFYCTVRGHPTPNVEWRRADGNPLPSGSHTVGTMLMIPAASVGDGSVYSCRASNDYGVVEARGALDVTARGSPPVVTVLTPDVAVTVGDDAMLRCSAEGVPRPELTWMKRGQGLPANAIEMGGSLKLASVTYSNQGYYICTARNPFGSDIGYVRVRVQRRPPSRPMCRTDPKQVTTYVGTNSTINCVVGGDPAPEVRWETEDGSALDDNIRVSGTQMFIHVVREANAGNYICVATNSAGESRSKMMLKVVKQALPTVTISPRPFVRVKAGRDTSFLCLTPDQQGVTVTWTRANGLSFTGNTQTSEGGRRLTFRRISTREEGSYICVATNGAGRRPASVRVTVIEPPVISLSSSGVIDATEGESVRLTCSVTGDPIPSVVWFKGSNMVTNYRQRSSVYSIESVDQTDAGVYVCRAYNEAGTSQEQIILNVEESQNVATEVAPVVSVSTPYVIKTSGNTATLSCSATGNPSPVITWSKRNGNLPDESAQSGGELRIRNLSLEDVGNYECRAANVAGQDTTSVFLTVIVRPSAAINIDTSTPGYHEGDSMTIQCSALEGVPEPTFSVLKDGQPISTEATYSIGSLTSTDSGSYSCVAVNAAGQSRATVDIAVTPRQTPQVKRSVVETRSGEELRLNCLLDDDASPLNVNWTKQDETLPDGRVTSSNEFVKDPATVADAGVYVCTAIYSPARVVSTVITVYVHAYIPYFSQTPRSYIAVPFPSEQSYSSFNITVSFRPNAFDGLLFFAFSLNQDFLSLSLNNGYVEFRYELGSGTATIRSRSAVELHRWHTVTVSRSEFSGEMRVDNEPVVRGRSPGEFRALDVNSDLYVGGVPSVITLPDALQNLGTDVGFYGCISQLNTGNGFVDFGAPHQVSELIGIVRCKTCGARKRDSPCQNEGLCVETHLTQAGFICNCPEDFGGNLCENVQSATNSLSRRRRLFERPNMAIVQKPTRTTTSNTTSPALHFNANSFALGQSTYVFHRYRTDIELKIRFDSYQDGLIVFSGLQLIDSPYFSLAIRNHFLEFHFKNSAGTHFVRTSVTSLPIGSWHTIIALRRRGRCQLIVDGNVVARKTFPDSGRLYLSAPIHLGSGHERTEFPALHHLQSGFSGCLTSLKIDGSKLDFERFHKISIGTCSARIAPISVSETPRNPQHSAAFESTSYSSFPNKVFRHSKAAEQISLRFKTDQPYGLILLHTQKSKALKSRSHLKKAIENARSDDDYIKLQIRHSLLIYSFQINGQSGRMVSRSVVSDGAWHNVALIRRGSMVQMWLDNEPFPILAQSEGDPGAAHLSGRVYIGGVPQGLQFGRIASFEGCIVDVRLTAISKKLSISVHGSLDDSETERLDFSSLEPSKQSGIVQCVS